MLAREAVGRVDGAALAVVVAREALSCVIVTIIPERALLLAVLAIEEGIGRLWIAPCALVSVVFVAFQAPGVAELASVLRLVLISTRRAVVQTISFVKDMVFEDRVATCAVLLILDGA